MTYRKAIAYEIEQGASILRPGWVRLNFNYFIAEEEFEYLVKAIELVAQYGWRLLPFYHFDAIAGVWRYENQHSVLVSSLQSLCLADYCTAPPTSNNSKVSLLGQCERAERELRREDRAGEKSILELSDESERLRWFVLPQELTAQL